MFAVIHSFFLNNFKKNVIIGISGNVSIDSNGDRNADYSLLDMDPDSGLFQVP